MHLSIVRWLLLLRLQNVTIPFVRLWHMTMVSLFCGTFLPGGVGQDAMRIFYASRDPECRMGPAVASVVADRVLGLTGLLALATVFLGLTADHIQSSPIIRAFAAVTLGSLAVVIVTFSVAVVLGNRSWLRQWLRALPDRSGRLSGAVGSLAEAARLYHGQLAGVLVPFVLSMLIHLLMTAAVIALASTLNLGGIDQERLGLASLLSYLANVLPITPGGIGVGEATFDKLCRLLITDQPQAISYGSVFLAARTLSIAVSLLGAVALIAQPDRRFPWRQRSMYP